ncbi:MULTISPECIES: DUF418 domain-containing protein [Brachybacterium]|uniref:DUF418 domain-containing protein n=2 Tax=Brachybacterium TaxID=43668 RepID=A0A426SJG3_9MICO|nr:MULTISPECIES: DUF418 domain-containing protein [Brachybacterium]RRR18308.1 hypothetical protein DS079_11230 [Brachybacterium paraconglomeratum]GLI30422.1 hypothetical protein BCONGLO52_12630 [Brachybacterium conglomeratum]GLK04961.1 hypothetical protein GCM10017597_17610 [Brachybacterium conglomeratum]
MTSAPVSAHAPDPSSATAPAVAPPRSLAPDVARGLMLALIAVANVSWYLWRSSETVGGTPHIPADGPLDSIAQAVMTIAVDHRAMPLFAFLFGYGMVQFYRSRIDRGLAPGAVRVMMRRRHWAMLLLGALHAALLFYGDILGVYAVSALVLVWWFFGRRSRTLRIWVIVLAAVMMLFALFSLLSGVALTYFVPAEVTAEMAATDMGTGFVRPVAYDTPYLVSVLYRLGLWAVSLPFAALMGAPLPILLGWLAARRRILDEPWRHVRLLRRTAVIGIAIGWLGGVPEALAILGLYELPAAAPWMLTGLTSLTGIACGIGYAALFGLLALRLEGRKPADEAHRPDPSADRDLSPAERAYGVPRAEAAPARTREPGAVERTLAAVGQRSLTFYLFQSLLLAPLMAAWGLGLGGTLSTAPALAIAFAVWLVSLPIAAWMGARGIRGPAERLLRRMTYGKIDAAPATR